MAPRRRPSEQRAWLEGDPPLAELRAAFPAEWARVQKELAEVVERDDLDAVKAYAARVAAPPRVRGGGEPEVVSALARQRLAAAALRERAPAVVICSWPPAGNPFEQFVFKTASVELYIVIASRSEFAAGNWAAYRGQDAFTMRLDEELSRLVLPPEIASAVYVFERSAG